MTAVCSPRLALQDNLAAYAGVREAQLDRQIIERFERQANYVQRQALRPDDIKNAQAQANGRYDI